MPIYEYRCLACKRRSSVFVRSVSSPVSPQCEKCGSKRMQRLLSRFAVHGGSERIDLDDPSSFDSIDESDPRAMARIARQMAEESGEPMDAEFEEMVGRMEAGESPDELMDDEGGMDAGDDDF